MDSYNFTAIEELECAGKQLRAMLDHYVGICSEMDSLLPGALLDVPQRYLHIISTETSYSPSYKLKVKQAETTICRVRNRLSQLAPVTSLPPEILVHIFHLATKQCDLQVTNIIGRRSNSSSESDSDSGSGSNLGSSPDSDSESSTTTDSSEDWNAGGSEGSGSSCERVSRLEELPANLDNLTHVCSRWRQTAISVPSLWTHIDYVPHMSFDRGFLTRAETYLTRAGQLPVELHVADSQQVAYNETALRRFLSSIRHRVKSLNVAVDYRWRYFHFCILDEIFRVVSPDSAILAELTTSFPVPNDNLDEFIDWLDDLGSISRLTVLHLRGLFPVWGSTAYHNLVDLRLAAPSDARWTGISEQQFRNMLEASPGLRILHFSLQITDQTGDAEPIVPVHLNDLEVLNICTDRGEEYTILRPGHIFRLISPGSKPLRLSIWHSFFIPNSQDDQSMGDLLSLYELAHFFQRANIVKFYAKGVCPPLGTLICHSPALEDLVLDSCVFPWRSNNPFLWKCSTETFYLKSLILHQCSPTFEQLDLLLQRYPAKRPILAKCDWTYIEASTQCNNPVRRVSELLEKYPATELIVQSSNPTADWNII